MTVEQVWQYGAELGAKYYCSSRGGAVCLDEEARSYLIDFGVCNADYDGSLGARDNASYVQYVADGAPVWELSFLGMTYRAFRADLYDFGAFDPGAEPARFGNMGAAERIERDPIDPTAAQPLPLELELRYLPLDALRVAGTQIVMADPDALGDYAAILVSPSGEQTALELFYYTANDALEKIQSAGEPVAAGVAQKINGAIAAVPGGTIAFLDGWISLSGLPAGEYALYLQLNGATYDTGMSLTL